MNRRVVADFVWPLAVFGALAFVPRIGWSIPKLFDGAVSSPGTLQLLALCLLFGGLALTYDLLFGFTGLLSFGHALYIAIGAYMTNIALTDWHWSFAQALLFTAVLGFVVPLALGTISLRVSGIAFAMVTLAFAQAGNVIVQTNPDGLTGGDEGFGLNYEALPSFLVGVFNTKYLYWLALGYAAAVFLIARAAIGSSTGHVWHAIRDNERRVEVIGLRPYPYKLIVFVLASFLAAWGGFLWLLLVGVTPEVTSATLTLTLLVMVVLGGAGARFGAMIGGFFYTLLDYRLRNLAGEERIQDLPDVLRIPLSEPLFLLGALFVAVVYFVPGGLASLPARLRALRRAQAVEDGR